ncbi:MULTISPECIES: hypothetical protein [Planktothricoides]|nr:MULTISPECIES: hypothetical protein [Planktothricoides]
METSYANPYRKQHISEIILSTDRAISGDRPLTSSGGVILMPWI